MLKNKYGEKVYKLPVNLPVTCPNRDGAKGTGGCIFCGGEGAGFELLSDNMTVERQLKKNMEYIGKKYNARKFIAYFQNFSNTYLPFDKFKEYISQAVMPDIVAIYISTRPDCIYHEHMELLQNIHEQTGINITIELGLQSISDETLFFLNRGHTVDDFFKGVDTIKSYGLDICAHVINDLPKDSLDDVILCAKRLSEAGVDQVKCHSLYILDNTRLGDMYKRGDFEVLTLNDFLQRTIEFLCHLKSDIAIQRLIGRAPKERTLFCNWSTGWWKIQDMIVRQMMQNNLYQGCKR